MLPWATEPAEWQPFQNEDLLCLLKVHVNFRCRPIHRYVLYTVGWNQICECRKIQEDSEAHVHLQSSAVYIMFSMWTSWVESTLNDIALGLINHIYFPQQFWAADFWCEWAFREVLCTTGRLAWDDEPFFVVRSRLPQAHVLRSRGKRRNRFCRVTIQTRTIKAPRRWTACLLCPDSQGVIAWV